MTTGDWRIYVHGMSAKVYCQYRKHPLVSPFPGVVRQGKLRKGIESNCPPGVLMRALLWLIAVLLLLGSVAIITFLLKGKPTSVGMPNLGLSDFVNVAILLVAVVSLYVAVVTYVGAKAAAEQQQKSLDASRGALESVVQTARGQQQLLEQNLETSKTQLALVQKQWEQDQERRARRAQLSILSLSGTPWGQIEQANHTVQITVPAAGWIRLSFVFRNTGTAPLIHPMYILVATPANVFLDDADFRISERANHNRFQLSGADFLFRQWNRPQYLS